MVVLSPRTDDEIRSLCGLSRTQWDNLVSAGFTPAQVRTSYQAFVQAIQSRIAEEFKRPADSIDGVPHLSTVQAAEALGVGEYHLSTMRSRGKLIGTKFGRRTFYSREQLESFLTDPEQAQAKKSALALAFIRMMERKRR